MKRTVTTEETEAALAEMAWKLWFGMELNPAGPCSLFAALLDMHGLWRSGPFKVKGETEMRGLPG